MPLDIVFVCPSCYNKVLWGGGVLKISLEKAIETGGLGGGG